MHATFRSVQLFRHPAGWVGVEPQLQPGAQTARFRWRSDRPLARRSRTWFVGVMLHEGVCCSARTRDGRRHFHMRECPRCWNDDDLTSSIPRGALSGDTDCSNDSRTPHRPQRSVLGNFPRRTVLHRRSPRKTPLLAAVQLLRAVCPSW